MLSLIRCTSTWKDLAAFEESDNDELLHVVIHGLIPTTDHRTPEYCETTSTSEQLRPRNMLSPIPL